MARHRRASHNALACASAEFAPSPLSGSEMSICKSSSFPPPWVPWQDTSMSAMALRPRSSLRHAIHTVAPRL